MKPSCFHSNKLEVFGVHNTVYTVRYVNGEGGGIGRWKGLKGQYHEIFDTFFSQKTRPEPHMKSQKRFREMSA